MQETLLSPGRAGTSDRQGPEIAEQLIAQCGLAGVAQALAILADSPSLWRTEECQSLFVQAIGAVIEGFNLGEAAQAAAALAGCDAPLAGSLLAMMHAALFGEGAFDAAAMGDPFLLCYLLLEAAAGRQERALALLDCETERRGAGFAEAAERVAFAIAPFHRFKPKLIVWDLDDTLWRGTLAEGDRVELIEHRAALVRALNDHGIVSAICSKNDPDAARARLEALGLWDAFVFPRIAFVPKGEAVRRLIADMQLRPANVLFVDDNPHNLHEVAAAVPGIRILDARSAECDERLVRILAEHRHVRKSRVEEYRVLQGKVEERVASGLSNEDFLRASDIRIAFTRLTENVQFAERIEELINRSNQLNYTESRVEAGSLAEQIMRIDENDTHAVFVWDRYGDYGLVGFAAVDPDSGLIRHFALSCRVMHMGIEDALIQRLREFYVHNLRFDGFRKALPVQPAVGITRESPLDPAVRQRILARDAPRDLAKARLRLMCDCQSGALHHYSRFRDEVDFDANPRLFSLPMMRTGEHLGQYFPRYLVIAAATDYLPYRWQDRNVAFDAATYAQCARMFCRFVADGDRRLLVLLPPEDAPERCYHPATSPRRSFRREDGLAWNGLWRELAAQHPRHVELIDLGGTLAAEEMVDACHYRPSALRELAGAIDQWYAAASAG